MLVPFTNIIWEDDEKDEEEEEEEEEVDDDNHFRVGFSVMDICNGYFPVTHLCRLVVVASMLRWNLDNPSVVVLDLLLIFLLFLLILLLLILLLLILSSLLLSFLFLLLLCKSYLSTTGRRTHP